MYFTQKQNGNEVIITKISFTTNIAMLDEKKKDQQTQPMTIRSFLTRLASTQVTTTKLRRYIRCNVHQYINYTFILYEAC